MAGESEPKLSRKTVSMEANLYRKADDRWRKLGYSSFSEYIQFLIDADVTSRPDHVTSRGEKGTFHSVDPPREYAKNDKRN